MRRDVDNLLIGSPGSETLDILAVDCQTIGSALYLARVGAVHTIVLEHVGSILAVDEWIVDGNALHIIALEN